MRPLSAETPLPAGAQIVFDVRYTGEDGGEPDVGALAAALGGSVRFLHGGIERIQGRAQGRLVIAASAAGETGAVAALLARARGHANRAEVLGYV